MRVGGPRPRPQHAPRPAPRDVRVVCPRQRRPGADHQIAGVAISSSSTDAPLPARDPRPVMPGRDHNFDRFGIHPAGLTPHLVWRAARSESAQAPSESVLRGIRFAQPSENDHSSVLTQGPESLGGGGGSSRRSAARRPGRNPRRCKRAAAATRRGVSIAGGPLAHRKESCGDRAPQEETDSHSLPKAVSSRRRSAEDDGWAQAHGATRRRVAARPQPARRARGGRLARPASMEDGIFGRRSDHPVPACEGAAVHEF